MTDHKNENLDNTIYLIGNPNVGKSVIFTALTKKYATISNYPGTTVEVIKGNISGQYLKKKKVQLVDTPGVNNLVPLSEDERVTRDIIINHEKNTGTKPNVVLIIDAKNLRRGLILAFQLSYADIPFFVVLNMMDEVSSLGITIDRKTLEKKLGVPVVETIAIQKEGISEILDRMQMEFPLSSYALSFPQEHRSAIEKMMKLLNPLLALSVFYSDTTIRNFITDQQLEKAEKILSTSKLNQKKFQSIWMNNANGLMSSVYQRELLSNKNYLNVLGRFTTRPFTGFLMLFAVLYVVYKFVGVLGAQTGVEFLEETIFNGYLNPLIKQLFTSLPVGQFIQDLFVGEYGLITMGLKYAIAIILPIVITFFIAFSFLEDSGYLPRMGALLNNFFKFMGLNGKAVLPMVLGLGCDTMATMTARVLDNKKERILVTLLLALGVPCSAQLGVVIAMGSKMGNYLYVWIAIIIFVLLTVGFLASKVIPGNTSMFFMELPPIRIPRLGNILRKTYMRSKWYVKEAVPIFLVGTFILFIMDKTGALPGLNRLLEPITVSGLGLPAESAKSFILGFLRRDFGAAGFYEMQEAGLMDQHQTLVALVVITLFIPCIANLLMIVKERGLIVATSMVLFIVPFSFLFGSALHRVMNLIGV